MPSGAESAIRTASDPLAAEDPQGALRQALAASPPTPFVAEDVVLAWLLRLPHDMDPAHAACRILAAHRPEPPGDERLSRLLAEIACWPAERLHCARRRGASAPQ